MDINQINSFLQAQIKYLEQLESLIEYEEKNETDETKKIPTEWLSKFIRVQKEALNTATAIYDKHAPHIKEIEEAKHKEKQKELEEKRKELKKKQKEVEKKQQPKKEKESNENDLFSLFNDLQEQATPQNNQQETSSNTKKEE